MTRSSRRKALGTVFPQASLGRPCPGACKWATVETATLAGAVGALFLAWLATDGWALNDVIAGCTAVTMIAVLRLPSLRVATILLSGLFFYDVFWVFVSPYIFGDNVMVAAATSAADNPMQEAAEALHIPGVMGPIYRRNSAPRLLCAS